MTASLHFPPWLVGRYREPCPQGSTPLTLAVLRLTEALPLLREAVAGPKAGFNPPALPWLMPANDAAPWRQRKPLSLLGA